MGRRYVHLTSDVRINLYEKLFSGMAISQIASELGYHRATIYRELARNTSHYGYRPDWAAQQTLQRRFKRTLKLDKQPSIRNYVYEKLQQGWSPEQIAGRLRDDYGSTQITCETIYRYIYSQSGKALQLYRCLAKKRRFRYPRIKRRRQKAYREPKPSIHEREDVINQRDVFGHWEGDLVVFSKQSTNLITLRERKSRYLQVIKNTNRKAKTTLDTLIGYMKKRLGHAIDSLTLDNDPSFARYKQMALSLQADIYFCDPYKSYQKGAIENANRLVRTVLPRQTDMTKIRQTDLDQLADKFNNKPMKCLGFKTPHEVFLQELENSSYFKNCRTSN